MVDCSWIRKIDYVNIKIHYFLFNGALACVIPYLPVHAKEIGISAVSVGVIYCILPIVTMFSKPFFGAVADHFNNIKTMLLIFLGAIMLSCTLTVTIPRKQNMISSKVHCTPTGTTLYFNTKPSLDCMAESLKKKPLKCYMYCTECLTFGKRDDRWSPPKKQQCVKEVVHSAEVTVHLEHHNSSSHVFDVRSMYLDDRDMNPLCFVNVTFNCSSYCEPILQECYTGKEEPEYTSDQFWLFLIFAMMCVSFSGVATSFTDAICFNELGENAHLYGKQRLWGTLGWGVFSPIAGYFNDLVTGDSFLKAYQPGAILQIFVFAYNISIANRLKTKSVKYSQNVWKDLGKILRTFKVLAFMLSVLVIGSFSALLWSYLYWHLGTLGASRMLLGVIPAVQCGLGELPFFFFSGKIIAKLGHFNTLALSFIAFGIRFMAYTFVKDPWMVLPIEILQGPTYGLFYATMASYANFAALPGTEVSTQGLISAAFELGLALGNLVGGITMQLTDGFFTFQCASIVSFSYCIIHFMLTCIMNYKEGKELRQQQVVPPPEEGASFIAENA